MNQLQCDRDLEKEREDLLKLIEQNIPAEVKANISYVASITPEPQIPKVTISIKGAHNAD
jgi:hypothetical protein